jgi:predicted dehydrogenase
MNIIPSIVLGSGFGERVVSQILKKNNKFDLLGIISRKNSNNNKSILKKNINKKKIFFLTTPPHTHYQFIKKFSNEKGLIICEKPLANNFNDAKKILPFKKKILCINHQLRFSKISKILKKKLNHKNISKIEIFHESNHSIKNKRFSNWWSKTELGGGQLFALGSHLIDFAVFFCGKLKSVDCILKVNRSKKKISDDFFVLKMFSNNNCSILIKSNSYTKTKERLEINFYTKDNKNYKIINFNKLYKDNKLIYKEKINKDKFLNENFWRICFNNFINELYNKVRFKKKIPLCTLQEALYTQKVIDAAHKSNKLQRLINIK